MISEDTWALIMEDINVDLNNIEVKGDTTEQTIEIYKSQTTL